MKNILAAMAATALVATPTIAIAQDEPVARDAAPVSESEQFNPDRTTSLLIVLGYAAIIVAVALLIDDDDDEGNDLPTSP